MHSKCLLLLTDVVFMFRVSAKAQTAEERAKIVQEYQTQNLQFKNARQAMQVARVNSFNHSFSINQYHNS